MDTLYLAQASSPRKVNPSVATCRTWGREDVRGAIKLA